ncbi:mucin-19 isoform X1 [Hyalella azteca]|uniref:Mucin-19 isoform X1 n=1 Tax=Hyalella azteca TaxID=294128 RepID=A0A8B7P9D2_HYAAZ|nr:mucin-19 isoform X1 [Hyalella azteca]
MECNRSRYKQVGSKFRSSEDSRAIRAISREDGRRALRSNVVQIHRNIPENLSPESSPSTSAIQSAKKSSAYSALAKARAAISRMTENNSSDDKPRASPRDQALKKAQDGSARLNQASVASSSKPPVKKTSKLIGGKTLEALQKERLEMLRLYKQRKQRALEKQKINKKPHFWLGVAKAESHVLLWPSASSEKRLPAKVETPSKAPKPIWHSGFSSMSKKNLVSRGAATSSMKVASTRKVASPMNVAAKEALRSHRQLFTRSSNDAAMAGTSSQGSFTRISSKNISRGSGKTGIKPGYSFAPEGYKFSAPSGLENLPRAKRPSIRFSATPPSVTPPSTGTRRMPRSKTPKPSNCEVPLEDDLVAEATVLPNTHSSSNSPANPGDQKTGKKRSFELGVKKHTQSNEVPSEEENQPSSKKCRSANRPSTSSNNLESEANTHAQSELRKRTSTSSLSGNKNDTEMQNSNESVHLQLSDGPDVGINKVSSDMNNRNSFSSDVGSGDGAVTPPNTAASYAVRDQSYYRSRERSVSKVSKSSSVKKSNLISRLNFSAVADEVGNNEIISPMALINSSVGSVVEIQLDNSTNQEDPTNISNNPLKLLPSPSNRSWSSSPVTRFSVAVTEDSSPKPAKKHLIPNSVHSRADKNSLESRSSEKSKPSCSKIENENSREWEESQWRVNEFDEIGCSPVLQLNSRKKNTEELRSSSNENDSATVCCAPSTPAPSTSCKVPNSGIRRSTRFASTTLPAEDDEVSRTPSGAAQRLTAVTPCSRSTRRSLAVHAAATWQEICAANPLSTASTPSTRGHRNTINNTANSNLLPEVVNADCDASPPTSTAKNAGKRSRRKTIITNCATSPTAAENVDDDLSPPASTTKTPGKRGRHKIINTDSTSSPTETGEANVELLSTAKTPGKRGRRKTINTNPTTLPPEAVNVEDDPSPPASTTKTPGKRGRRKTINTNSVTSIVETKTVDDVASPPASSTKTPGKRGRRKTLNTNSVTSPMKTENVDDVASPPASSTKTPGKRGRRKTLNTNSVTSLMKTENVDDVESPRASSSKTPGKRGRRKTINTNSVTSPMKIENVDDVASPPASSTKTPGKRGRRKTVLAMEPTLESEAGGGLTETVDAEFAAVDGANVSDSTLHTPSFAAYSIMAELLRPTTPLSTDDSDTDVWDSILSNSSPALPDITEQKENDEQELVTDEAEIEVKENQDPQEENGCLKKHNMKPKRRSSLREGVVLRAIKSRRDSALNSRVSLGLFAPGALESPVMAAAPSGDLISWESPATATSKEDGDVDLMCLNSPQIKADSGRGRSGRVSRLAALYEQHTSSPASSPATSRRSLRQIHISP